MLISGVAALIIFPPAGKPDEADQEEDENARRERLGLERDTEASVAFNTALEACRGLPTRLTRIAEAAEAKAASLRHAHDAGLVAGPDHVNPDWRPSLGAPARHPATPPSSPGSSWTEPSTNSPPCSTTRTLTYKSARPRTTRSEKPRDKWRNNSTRTRDNAK
jgi:hypothetical protein